jgi:hypothetical protein
MKVSLLIVVFIPLASILDVKNNSEIWVQLEFHISVSWFYKFGEKFLEFAPGNKVSSNVSQKCFHRLCIKKLIWAILQFSMIILKDWHLFEKCIKSEFLTLWTYSMPIIKAI